MTLFSQALRSLAQRDGSISTSCTLTLYVWLERFHLIRTRCSSFRIVHVSSNHNGSFKKSNCGSTISFNVGEMGILCRIW